MWNFAVYRMITDHVSRVGEAIGRVRPLVCFYSSFWTKCSLFWFFVRIWVMAVAHRGLKVKVSQGQGSWLRLARIVTRSVWPRSSIEGSLFDSLRCCEWTAVQLVVCVDNVRHHSWWLQLHGTSYWVNGPVGGLSRDSHGLRRSSRWRPPWRDVTSVTAWRHVQRRSWRHRWLVQARGGFR